MSANMLDNEEFQEITDWMFSEMSSPNSPHRNDIMKFVGLLREDGTYRCEGDNNKLYLGDFERAAENAGRHLYNLNRLALTTRYGLPYERKDDTKFKPEIKGQDISKKIISTLQKLSYQCHEYIIMETQTAKDLEHLIGRICINLFREEQK